MNEQWHDIKGYEGIYIISDSGRIATIRNPSKSSEGYPHIHLTKNGKAKLISVHRLIALHFIPNPLKKRCVNHKNGVKDDNRIENLEWCTHAENMQHAFGIGTQKGMKGRKHPMAKLTEDEVLEIRKSKEPHYMISAMYDISLNYVGQIKRKERWKHI